MGSKPSNNEQGRLRAAFCFIATKHPYPFRNSRHTSALAAWDLQGEGRLMLPHSDELAVGIRREAKPETQQRQIGVRRVQT